VEAPAPTFAEAAADTPAPVVASQEDAAPPPTTVQPISTVQPASTVPPTSAAPLPSETGPASWYPAAPGTCAHPTLPFGTVVTITDLATGTTATCTVDDRGPYEGGRIIDLSPDVFAQLAPDSAGVIEVRITW
jgi:rare lipoprotein A (peptidoglycan hydrolase)